MSVFALIAALILEQVHPLPAQRFVYSPLSRLAALAERNLNAGEAKHGAIAWALLVGGLGGVGAVAYWTLSAISPVLGWVWSCVVLYATLGFRQFSHYFSDIQEALRVGEVPKARQLLREWCGVETAGLGSSDISRLAIESGLRASHRHVFAVVFWFVVLPGPSGAIIYRVSAMLADAWGERQTGLATFGSFARMAFAVMDWLPQRLTAMTFAIVGDFEDAIHCWRAHSTRGTEDAMGVVVASGSGALGVRLGTPFENVGNDADRAMSPFVGDEADVDYMQSTVGLVWRALLLWLLLLFLLSVARWAG